MPLPSGSSRSTQDQLERVDAVQRLPRRRPADLPPRRLEVAGLGDADCVAETLAHDAAQEAARHRVVFEDQNLDRPSTLTPHRRRSPRWRRHGTAAAASAQRRGATTVGAARTSPQLVDQHQLAAHLRGCPCARRRPAVRAIGSSRSITGLILPCGIPARQLGQRARRWPAGSRRAKSPQNTPTIDAPLSSARFSGSAGIAALREADHQIAPAPGDRAEDRLGQVAADRVVDDVGALAVGQPP